MGTTFEEQQAAREEYQAKVRASKRGGKPVNINPTMTTPNPSVDNVTVGESANQRKDETTSDQIIESGEAMGTYGKPAVQRVEGGDTNAEPVEEEDGDQEQVSDSESEDASDTQSDSESENGGEKAAPERPSHSDKKAEWVSYVAALTGESEKDVDDKYTKEELVTQFGG